MISSTLQPLSVENIQCGQLVEEINSKIALVAQDALDRYTIQKERVVLVKIMIKPGDVIETRSGKKLMPGVDWEVRHSVPGSSGMTTRAYVENLHGKQTLMVNASDPFGTEPNQTTIFDNLPTKEDSTTSNSA